MSKETSTKCKHLRERCNTCKHKSKEGDDKHLELSNNYKHHVLRLTPGLIQIMYDGLKSFDIRSGKRNINVGDTVVFIENGTNKQFACKVTFVLKSWKTLPEWKLRELGDFVTFCWRLGEGNDRGA